MSKPNTRNTRGSKGKEPAVSSENPASTSTKPSTSALHDDDFTEGEALDRRASGRKSVTPNPEQEDPSGPRKSPEGGGGNGGDGGDGDGGDAGGDGGIDALSDDDDFNIIPAADPSLREVLNAIAGMNRGQSATAPPSRPARTRAREPDPFSGADPDKLPTFLFQCRLYFRANPAQFEADSMKVNFALTFLTDVALRWFETGIDQEETLGILAPWLYEWSEFVDELQTHFGLADLKGEAAELLENLRMKPGDKITTYNVEFMRLSSRLTWDNDSLVYRFYKGLPDRLQDKISELPAGKPKSLLHMRNVAMSFDNRYWERQRERTRARTATESAAASQPRKYGGQTPSASTSKSPTSSASTPNNNNNNNNNKPKGFTATKPSTSTSSSSTTPKSAAGKPDLTDKLGKDGKLTPEERKRRLDGNLCLFCGNAGHSVSDCRKKAASLAKAAAAKATPSVTSSITGSEN
jgi:hypothetical protein